MVGRLGFALVCFVLVFMEGRNGFLVQLLTMVSARLRGCLEHASERRIASSCLPDLFWRVLISETPLIRLIRYLQPWSNMRDLQ